jgi:hypothetical protein
MKRKTSTFLAAAFAALFGASCALMAPGSGKILLDIPADMIGSVGTEGALSSARSTSGDIAYARVWLESTGTLQKPIQKQVTPTDSTIEIDEVAPGKYYLHIALGLVDGSGFRTLVYATSDEFSVTAGATEDVTVKAQYSKFEDKSTQTDTANGVRMAVVGGTVYTLANGTLYWNDGSADQSADLSGIGAIGLGAGKVLTSVSDGEGGYEEAFGAEQLWINTAASGVRPFDPKSKTYGDDITGGSWKGYTDDDGVWQAFDSSKSRILESGVMDVNDGTDSVKAAYYQRSGSLGFGFYADDPEKPEAWEWDDLYAQFDDPSFDDLKDIIKDSTTKLIADFHSSGSYGYVLVPAINNVRVYAGLKDELDWLNDSDNTETEGDPEYNELLDVIVGANEENVLKRPDNSTPQTVSQEGSYLFIGTKTGLFSTTVNTTDGTPDGTATRISAVSLPNKEGVDIVRVRSRDIGGTVWTAALSRAGNLFLLRNGGLAKTYRFHSGLPTFGSIPDAGAYGEILWTEAGLYVSGINGVVLLKTADLGN